MHVGLLVIGIFDAGSAGRPFSLFAVVAKKKRSKFFTTLTVHELHCILQFYEVFGMQNCILFLA